LGATVADGSISIQGEAEGVAKGSGFARRIQAFFGWLTGKRQGLLTIWATVAGLALAGAVGAHFAGPLASYLDNPVLLMALTGGSALLVLPLLLICLDPEDNYQKGPRRLLPFLSMALLAALATLVVWDNVTGAGLFAAPRDPLAGVSSEQMAARIALFAYLAVAFIPNIWNAANFARFDSEQREQVAKSAAGAVSDAGGQVDTHDDDADAMGALVGTLVVMFVGTLAILAGMHFGAQEEPKFENAYGLILCGVVIGVFVVVVFLDYVAESWPVQMMSRGLRAVARKLHFLSAFYDWVDTGLVRIGAAVAGMGQDASLTRYGLLAGTLACLCVLAWFLPAPLGLAPAFTGFIIAISVSRLWAWVEDDRALAAMTEYKVDAPYRVGFREDFRDETLLGFIFIFALAPIAMMQAHTGEFFGPGLFAVPPEADVLSWFGFFGVELAKAVPIVDWAEIYGISEGENVIKFESAAGRHAVFLARVMVDMVLIAALLQAIGIASRNRHQKRLFAARHVDRLDEFVERNEIARAIRVARRPAMGPITTDLKGADAIARFDLSKLGRDGVVNFRHYNWERLFHIYGSTEGHLERRTFIAAIAHQAGKPLLHAIDLTKQIAETNRNQPQMYAAFQRAIEEHTSGVNLMDADDLYIILTHLRSVQGLKDFKVLLIEWMERLGPPDEVADKLLGLGIGTSADRFQYTRNRIAAMLVSLASRIDLVGMLEQIRDKLLSAEESDQRPSEPWVRELLETIQKELDNRFPAQRDHDPDPSGSV
jgi:hypothetical protein